MDALIGGIGATAKYIKHGMDNYNRQAQVRQLMEKGGIQAIKDAIHSGELVGGAKKGLDNKKKRKRKTTAKKTISYYRPQPASARATMSRSLPYHNLGTISSQPMPQQISQPLLQRSGMAVMSQQQYDPSYAYQIQQTLRTIQEQKGEIADIKKATQQQLQNYRQQLEAEGYGSDTSSLASVPSVKSGGTHTRNIEALETPLKSAQMSIGMATEHLNKYLASASPISKPPSGGQRRQTESLKDFPIGKAQTEVGMKPPTLTQETQTHFQTSSKAVGNR